MRLATEPVCYWRDVPLDDLCASVESPARVARIRGASTHLAKNLIKNSMENVLLCTDQIKWLMRQMLERADAHADEHFKSSKQFIKNLYSEDPWGKGQVKATAITGLAGTGKSQFLLAFERLVELLIQKPPPSGKRYAKTPLWTMSIRSSRQFGDLIRPWLERLDQGAKYHPKRISDLKNSATKLTYREGVCLMLLDEFQFISRGASSTASAVALLLNFLSIGPRLGYIMNYELAHRLMGRPQEDQDRLFFDLIEVLPERAGSSDFKRLLREYMKVAPEDFLLDPNSIDEMMHTYTFGIPRAMVLLLCESWQMAKECRGPSAVVTQGDITRAYKGRAYFVHRMNVELLWKYGISGTKQRLDLRSPFVQLDSDEQFDAPRIAAEEFQRRVMHKHLDDSLTMGERLASKSIVSVIQNAGLEQPPSSKTKNAARRAKTKEELLASLKEFNRGIK